MLSSIFGMLNGLFGSVSKIMDFMNKKDTENTIRKGYEEEKRADTLEEDKVSAEIINTNKVKVKKIKTEMDAIKNMDISDADKTEDEISTIIENIEDPEEKIKKTKSIKAAKTVKARKTATKKKIEENKEFIAGEEITFKG